MIPDLNTYKLTQNVSWYCQMAWVVRSQMIFIFFLTFLPNFLRWIWLTFITRAKNVLIHSLNMDQALLCHVSKKKKEKMVPAFMQLVRETICNWELSQQRHMTKFQWEPRRKTTGGYWQKIMHRWPDFDKVPEKASQRRYLSWEWQVVN